MGTLASLTSSNYLLYSNRLEHFPFDAALSAFKIVVSWEHVIRKLLVFFGLKVPRTASSMSLNQAVAPGGPMYCVIRLAWHVFERSRLYSPSSIIHFIHDLLLLDDCDAWELAGEESESLFAVSEFHDILLILLAILLLGVDLSGPPILAFTWLSGRVLGTVLDCVIELSTSVSAAGSTAAGGSTASGGSTTAISSE